MSNRAYKEVEVTEHSVVFSVRQRPVNVIGYMISQFGVPVRKEGDVNYYRLNGYRAMSDIGPRNIEITMVADNDRAGIVKIAKDMKKALSIESKLTISSEPVKRLIVKSKK